MRVSFNWLKELIAFNLSAAELADMLTMAGVEVDSVEHIKPDFTKVVIGHILKISRHPNADKLVLCEVDVGGASPLHIVCGAPNLKEGDKVPVALVGAGLTGGLEVKKAKIRGQSSDGMLCSERELGISDDHSGIMILPPDVRMGADLAEALHLTDAVLDLAITPNRPDCLSMLGIAREVAALTHGKVQLPQVNLREISPDIGSFSSVTILDDVGCPRYAARIVSDVKIGPSPAWMQRRLLSAGLRPLSNVVDATNYVLIELGHPLHAFDYKKLAENRIVVRRARSGESIVTLDGPNRELSEKMLVIADAENPVAIAGIMGGAGSEVTEQTRTVLIESAYFDPVTIRRTSKALGLSTEASYRFERGADPEMVLLALDRAASLMADFASGKIASGRIDQYPRKQVPTDLKLRFKRVNKILGTEIQPDAATSILSSLGFETLAKEADAVRVRVPSYRPDATREIDLIEEVARIYGYDNIRATFPQDTAVMKRGLQPRSREDECRATMKNCGFTEVITFSFGAPADMVDLSDSQPGVKPIGMKNPLTEDRSVLRTSIIPGLLHTLTSNINTSRKDLKIFEVGSIYWPAKGQLLPDERSFVSAVATGLSRPANWKGHPLEVDFFDMKGVVEALLESLGFGKVITKRTSRPGFHPGICADILVEGKSVGTLGKIHPDLVQKYDIKQKIFAFEMDLSGLRPRRAETRYEKISRFPHADRDMAVVVDEDVEAAALTSIITETGADMLRRVLLFDIYRGAQVGDGKKSLAFSLRFQSDERTLRDEEINAAFDKIVRELERRFGAKLRA